MGLAVSRIALTGDCMLRRPKHSTIEGVVPKEDDEDRQLAYTP